MIFEKIRERLQDVIDGIEVYTVGRLNTEKANISILQLQRFANELKKINQVEAEYNNGWIPCSERLPADCEEDWVQVQIREKDTGFLWIPRTAEYRIDKWWLTDSDEPLEDVFEVIAWQPLPQPPKGE